MNKVIEYREINGVKCKQCVTCFKWIPANSEYFDRQSNNKDGLRGRCKSCRYILEKEQRKKYNQSRYANDKENILQQGRESYQRHREQRIEYSKQYYQEHREEELIKAREHKRKNKSKILADAKVYRESHQEEVKLAKQRCYENNKGHYKQYKKEYSQTEHGKTMINIANQRREAMKRNLPSDFTKDDWIFCKAYFENCCCYCGKKSLRLHQEHFIPVIKGGGYTKDNILPACGTCNASKHDNDFEEWYSKQRFYSNDKEKNILLYLNSFNRKEE